MTADSPASGLPQEAVDAAAFEGHAERTCGEHRTVGSHRAWCHDCGEWCYPDIEIACLGCLVPSLTALLAAERAKVAALQQAVDKVRALHTPYDHDSTLCRGCEQLHCRTVALLPAVQADDRGTATPTPATTCADCGTTRTVCDAGLNTYDTRCCEQCGHGEGK